MLSVEHVTKKYGSFTALEDISLTFTPGVFGLLAPNGAGKTTLIKMLTTLLFPTSGQILWNGEDIYALDEAWRGLLGYLPQEFGYYPHYSPRQFLRYAAALQCVPRREAEERIESLLKLVGLEDTGKKKARNFSLGMKQRLGIAVALAGSPDFLVLDEPVNGLDPQGIIDIRELILKLNRERNITVLISSHILDELSRLATHYGFIDSGRIVKELSARELEAACRKCLRVEVTDTRALARVLDGMGVDYKILSDGQADVFAQLNISQLSRALDGEGCELLSAQERDESLESYFVNLVGGASHD